MVMVVTSTCLRVEIFSKTIIALPDFEDREENDTPCPVRLN